MPRPAVPHRFALSPVTNQGVATLQLGVFAMSIRPLIVDWKGLKRMGWCYARAHTWRLMFDPDYADNAFPACHKLGKHRNSHPVWRVSDVLSYFESHGLAVTEDWNTPA